MIFVQPCFLYFYNIDAQNKIKPFFDYLYLIEY